MTRVLIGYSVVVLVLFALFPVGIEVVPPPWSATYLSEIPHVELLGIVLIKPSSTMIVYGLGILTILLGVLLHRKKDNPVANLWGLSLMIWGIGTMLAGSSYQGFGYELKCAGRFVCLFTSWFELAYLYVTALSILVMGYAISFRWKHPIQEPYQRGLLIGFFLYTITLLIGVLFEIHFLITYEYFLIVFVCFFLSFFVFNIRGYKEDSNPYDKHLIVTWLMLLVVNVLYFVYLLSEIGERLYASLDLWFSANDVLHVGLIFWMVYLYRTIDRYAPSH